MLKVMKDFISPLIFCAVIFTAKLSGEKLKDYEDLKSKPADDGSGNAVTRYLNKLKPQMVELFEQLNFHRYRFWAILILASVCVTLDSLTLQVGFSEPNIIFLT